MLCLKISGWEANCVDPDDMPHSAASHLDLLCLLRPVRPNKYSKYSICFYFYDNAHEKPGLIFFEQKLKMSAAVVISTFNNKISSTGIWI